MTMVWPGFTCVRPRSKYADSRGLRTVLNLDSTASVSLLPTWEEQLPNCQISCIATPFHLT